MILSLGRTFENFNNRHSDFVGLFSISVFASFPTLISSPIVLEPDSVPEFGNILKFLALCIKQEVSFQFIYLLQVIL